MFLHNLQNHFVIENRELSKVQFFSFEDFISPECRMSAYGVGIVMLCLAMMVF
jgi:hypothetical protein